VPFRGHAAHILAYVAYASLVQRTSYLRHRNVVIVVHFVTSLMTWILISALVTAYWWEWDERGHGQVCAPSPPPPLPHHLICEYEYKDDCCDRLMQSAQTALRSSWVVHRRHAHRPAHRCTMYRPLHQERALRDGTVLLFAYDNCAIIQIKSFVCLSPTRK